MLLKFAAIALCVDSPRVVTVSVVESIPQFHYGLYEWTTHCNYEGFVSSLCPKFRSSCWLSYQFDSQF